MKNFVAVIARIIAAMPKFVWQRVQVCGEWVSRLVAVPAAPAETVADTEVAKAASDRQADDMPAIKRVAGVLAQGELPTSEQLKGLTPKDLSWLKAQDRRALCIIMSADAQQLRAHMRGRAAIKGVVPYDSAAIREVTAARQAAVQNVRRAKPRRTLREALEEQGLHP
ncbi:hypothetical protein GCM10007989_25460 [Devosia pacifica]|uniref:Uncharacterized protein n=1 Tax=Devosia pacifica TaxID=1335967 RepID=A0A918VTU6_9HYPH|nr:hypothetical protein [Devosia pacifica]GHA28317.1 hypothetical protein GCM10007989_25460 [Devosia pacifica]